MLSSTTNLLLGILTTREAAAMDARATISTIWKQKQSSYWRKVDGEVYNIAMKHLHYKL